MTGVMKYTFGDNGGSNNALFNKNSRMKHRQAHHKRSPSGDDASEGNGSLTYSAASSINSTGESTDSSFADIMRVLDLQDNNGAAMAAIMQEKKHHKQQHSSRYPSGHPKSSSRSIASMTPSTASSLQYSTDSASHMLAGADIISTITGQPSDSYAYDYGNLGGGNRQNDHNNHISSNPAGKNRSRKSSSNETNHEPDVFGEQNIMFAPAEPAESIKRRKKVKGKNKGKDKNTSSTSSTSSYSTVSKSKSREHSHRRSGSRGSHSSSAKSSPSTPPSQQKQSNNLSTPSASKKYSQGTPNTNTPGSTGSGTSSANSTPPPIPPAFYTHMDDDDICYAKWWMSCFPDAFKNLMPKR